MFLAPASKLFRFTWVNKFTFTFFIWSVMGKQKNTVKFAVPVFWGVPLFRCSVAPVFRCPGVPGFRTCPNVRTLYNEFIRAFLCQIISSCFPFSLQSVVVKVCYGCNKGQTLLTLC